MSDARIDFFERVKAQSKAVEPVLLMTNVNQEWKSAGPRYDCTKWIAENGVHVFGMSKYHAKQSQRNPKFPAGTKIGYLYNPVNSYMDDIAKKVNADSSLVVNKDQLIYVSALEKGLMPACEMLQEIRKARPSVRLVVHAPSYSAEAVIETPACQLVKDGLDVRGAVSTEELARDTRSSFAVLYPGDSDGGGTTYRETFGNALVEANCVGTPVLADATGSLPEVLSAENALTDTNVRSGMSKEEYKQMYVDRLMGWYNKGRPQVSCSDQFHLEQTVRPLVEAFKGDTAQPAKTEAEAQLVVAQAELKVAQAELQLARATSALAAKK